MNEAATFAVAAEANRSRSPVRRLMRLCVRTRRGLKSDSLQPAGEAPVGEGARRIGAGVRATPATHPLSRATITPLRRGVDEFRSHYILLVRRRAYISDNVRRARTRATRKMRAGWMVQTRVHGMVVDGENTEVFRLPVRDDIHADVFFSSVLPHLRAISAPLIRTAAPSIPVSIEATDRPVPAFGSDGYTVRYAWMTAVVLRDIDLGVVSKDAKGNIDGHGIDEQVEDLLAPARLLSAAVAARYPLFVYELWGECRLYFDRPDGPHILRSSRPFTISAIAAVPLDQAALQRASRGARVALESAPRESRSIAVAGQHLLRGIEGEPESTEQFSDFFRCIETLAKRFSPPRDVAVDPDFSRLRAIVEREAPDLAREVDRLRNTYGNSLRQQFARLARELFPDSAAADIGTFDLLYEVRNRLAHRAVTTVTQPTDRRPYTKWVSELGRRYFLAVLDRLDGA
jgi:hypothetical protein